MGCSLSGKEGREEKWLNSIGRTLYESRKQRKGGKKNEKKMINDNGSGRGQIKRQ